jgi:hypothetical protein
MSREQSLRQHVERLSRVLATLVEDLTDGATGPETSETVDQFIGDVKRAVDRFRADRPRVASRV